MSHTNRPEELVVIVQYLCLDHTLDHVSSVTGQLVFVVDTEKTKQNKIKRGKKAKKKRIFLILSYLILYT